MNKTKGFLLVAAAMAFTFSCSSDGRGNNIGDFETVVIGTQTWMAKNLNYAVEGSKCGDEDNQLADNNTAYCDEYGRLYDWQTALTVCPSGWHLPSNEEWDELENSTDAHGFLAMLGGYGGSYDLFFNVGGSGTWWSAAESDSNYAHRRLIIYNDSNVYGGISGKSGLFSVRCVGD